MTKLRTGTAETLIVWVAACMFFVASLAGNLSAAHDSINYLYHISRGEHLFHQHHLLYHFFARGWLWLFGVPAYEYLVVEVFTALWASSVIAVCYLFFRRRFRLSFTESLLSVSVIAVSYGVWFYGSNIEVYMPPLFFVLASLYRITKDKVGLKDVIVVSVLHAAAVLFHQLHILLAPVLLYWIWANFPGKRMVAFSRYVAISAVIVGGIYILVGYVVEGNRTLESFSSWVMGYTVGHNYWHPLNSETPLKVAAGFVRVFIGGHFIFQLPPVKEALEVSFAQHSLADEWFLTRNLPAWLAWVLSVVSLIIAAMVFIIIVKFLGAFHRSEYRKRILNPLTITFVVYSIFFIFWMPEILEFWILQVIILWMMVLGTLPRSRLPFKWKFKPFVGSLAASLLLVNFFGSMLWLMSFKNDMYYQVTHDLPATEHDIVIVEKNYILKDYVRYFRKLEVIATDEDKHSKSSINEQIDGVIRKGGRAFINTGDLAAPWKTIQAY